MRQKKCESVCLKSNVSYSPISFPSFNLLPFPGILGLYIVCLCMNYSIPGNNISTWLFIQPKQLLPNSSCYSSEQHELNKYCANYHNLVSIHKIQYSYKESNFFRKLIKSKPIGFKRLKINKKHFKHSDALAGCSNSTKYKN